MDQAELPPLSFRTAMAELVGKECWSVIAGSGTGSIVTLNFGERIPVKRWLSNETLSSDSRRFEGEYALYIECGWRVRSPQGMICSWSSDNAANGPMLTGLQQLEGGTTSVVEISEETYDLRVEFEDGLSLDVFCDQVDTDPEASVDNYSLFTTDSILIVGPRSRLHRASRVRSA